MKDTIIILSTIGILLLIIKVCNWWIERDSIKPLSLYPGHRKTKTLFKFPPLYQDKPLEMWEEPITNHSFPSYGITIRHHAVDNLELLVNMKKVSLGLLLRLGTINYEEYGKAFDDLMEWKTQEWKKIYENKF
jgi:hypothetical protein